MALCMPSSENRKGRRAGSTSRSPNRPTGDDPGGVRVPIDLPEELRALRENGPERELNIDLMNPVPCQVASDGSMEPSEPTRDNGSSGVAEERLPEPVLERAAERLGPEILCGPDLRRTADWLSFAERIGSLREGARFPDFLGIGPTKTGTTWLARHLSQHPHIFVPAEKETGYFTHGWRLRQIDTYEEMFKEAGDRLKGELTPGYALLPSLAIRYIQQLNPQLKLIFLARRLAERASSQTRHSYRHYEMTFRNRTTAGFEELRNAELVADFVADYAVASSDYRGTLGRWLEYFPAEQFHVRYFEDAVANPEEYWEGLQRFLGVAIAPAAEDLNIPILEGMRAAIPPVANSFLERFFGSRQLEIERFLERTFDLRPTWRAPQTVAREGPLLLENRSEGWQVLVDEGRFKAVNRRTGEQMSGESLGDLRLQIDRQPRDQVSGGHAALTDLDRVLTASIDAWEADFAPNTGEQIGSFRGFSIVRWKNRYVGSRQAVGPIDMRQGEDVLLRKHSSDDLIVASTRPELAARIEAVESREALGRLTQRLDRLEAIRDSSEADSMSAYRDFNLVKFRGKAYGVRQSLGPLDFSEGDDVLRQSHGFRDLLIGESLGELRARIDAMEEVESLREDLRQGEIAARDELQRELQSLREAQRMVGRLSKRLDRVQYGPLGSPEGVSVAGSHGDFNLVHHGGKVYGVRQSLGPLDFSEGDDVLRQRYAAKDFLIGESAGELRARIDALEEVESLREDLRQKEIAARDELHGELQSLRDAQHTVGRLSERLDRVQYGPLGNPEGVSVAGSHGDFNLVHHGGKVYGVRQSLGPLDFSEGDDVLGQRYAAKDFLIGESAGELRARIDVLKEVESLQEALLAAQRAIQELSTTGVEMAGDRERTDKTVQHLSRMLDRITRSRAGRILFSLSREDG